MAGVPQQIQPLVRTEVPEHKQNTRSQITAGVAN